MPSFISCGLAVVELSVGASGTHREHCLQRMEAYRRPDQQLHALIDTGADTTVVDLGVLEAVCLSSYDIRKVQGFNGTWDEYPVYDVAITVRTKTGNVIFHDQDFEVVGAPMRGEHYQAILGMDVLAEFTLKFHRSTGFVDLIPTEPGAA